VSTTDPGMAELGRARAELKAALFKGVKGTAAEERAEHLIDEHQAALKHAHAHRLAEDIRREARKYGERTQMSMRMAANVIDPEPTRGAGGPEIRSGYPTAMEGPR
jgi:hypothetical protein